MMIIWIILMILSLILGIFIGLLLTAKAAENGAMFIIFRDLRTIGDFELFDQYRKYADYPQNMRQGLKILEELSKNVRETKRE